ncbi:hypothetical protein KIN20_008684 [Parelaphostrongylus tenuis]|uniref:Uncharacterized protein n=1 Tax=Parelaphostrongylus tenuis TaxID=148309 RepID=A0AAD5QMU5_PARTN|nr:hypothetical protein KIN20_008684 [Parelaphostrongylus tenuis]
MEGQSATKSKLPQNQDWSLNGANGTIYKCIPGPRTPRLVKPPTSPVFLVTPVDTEATIHSKVELRCSAIGSPVPFIHWMKNDDRIQTKAPEALLSTLVVNATEESAGMYTCYARNSVGDIKASAMLHVVDKMYESEVRKLTKRQVVVLTCAENEKPHEVVWYYRSRPLDRRDTGLHFMNNGSLVIADVESTVVNDFTQYTCKVHNRGKSSTVQMLEVTDVLPNVTVLPKKITVISGQSLNVSCIVKGSPLTTKISWMRNNEVITPDVNVHILANNSLFISTIKEIDKGRYTCMATTRIGSAYDETEVFVDEADPLKSDDKLDVDISSNTSCKIGFHWNGTYCEDINECDEADRCQYQCENILGSYNCMCPHGYELDSNNLQCFDINECDLQSCSNGQMCLNTYGDFHCIPNPCPENYSLSKNNDCIPECNSCSDLPINIRQISLHKGYRTDNGIGKVTAYDRSGNVLKDAVFAISDTENGLKLGSTKSGPFSIRSRRGEAVVYTSSRELPPGSIYYLRIRVRSQSSNHSDIHFMLIVSTGMYPF